MVSTRQGAQPVRVLRSGSARTVTQGAQSPIAPAALCVSRCDGKSSWRFMESLSDDGLILGGGPLGEEEKRILLVIAAENQRTIETRLADAPWTRLEVWRAASV